MSVIACFRQSDFRFVANQKLRTRYQATIHQRAGDTKERIADANKQNEEQRNAQIQCAMKRESS